jgi:hypothetical protein
MAVFVEGFEHRTGEHCASTALSNMLGYHGLPVSEPMVVGLGAGLGFTYIRHDDLSPTRMFHGRTMSLELDFCENAAIPVAGGEEPDDARAWDSLIACLDRGIPVMLSTDTYYLAYQNTTSHFPKHRAVVVGYDLDDDCVWMADRKLGEYQRVTREELRRARNADDYPMSCNNEYNYFEGRLSMGRPLGEAIRVALRRNAESMQGGEALGLLGTSSGIAAMRELAQDLPGWKTLPDWSWAARFGYQVIVKRGAGALFFRSLYRDFLSEAEQAVPALAGQGFVDEMTTVANRWGDLAAVLKVQSERDSCDPKLFEQAAEVVTDLADLEEQAFRRLADAAADDALWSASA